MIRTILLSLVFIITLVVSAVLITPLEYVLRQVGLNQMGVGWASVEGNIVKGRVNGFFVGTQPVGDVRLSLKPLSLFTGKISYAVTWSGLGGRGAAEVVLNRKRLWLNDVRAQQDIQAIETLAAPIRTIGGTVRVANGAATLTRAGCEDASGRVTTDVLSRAAAQFGKSFSPISGPVSCVSGSFVLSMEGQSELNDKLTLTASVSPLGLASLEAIATITDPELAFVMPQAGFERRDDAWYYTYTSNLGRPR